MKTILLYACLVLGALTSFGADTPIEINLLDGSRIKGRVMSATASDLTFMTDFGISRIPLDILTPESKLAVSQGTKPDVDALLRRVSELEAKVSQLQQENESLRRQAVATPTYRPPSGAQSLTPPRIDHTTSSRGKSHHQLNRQATQFRMSVFWGWQSMWSNRRNRMQNLRWLIL